MTIDAGAQDASPVTLAAARAEFDAAVTYLNSATFGLGGTSAGAHAMAGRHRRRGCLRPAACRSPVLIRPSGRRGSIRGSSGEPGVGVRRAHRGQPAQR